MKKNAKETPTPRAGRPPAAGEPRDVELRVRVTRSEREAILAAGGSEWVRGLVREALVAATGETRTQ